jgi:hypothetical protein
MRAATTEQHNHSIVVILSSHGQEMHPSNLGQVMKVTCLTKGKALTQRCGLCLAHVTAPLLLDNIYSLPSKFKVLLHRSSLILLPIRMMQGLSRAPPPRVVLLSAVVKIVVNLTPPSPPLHATDKHDLHKLHLQGCHLLEEQATSFL